MAVNLMASGVHAERRGAVRAGGLPMAVCSALLLALALPNDLFPLGSPLFGAACLAPLLVALYRSRSYRHAAWLGAVFGVCASVLSNFWLLFFQSFSAWTLGGVTLAYLGYHAVLAAVLRFAAGVPRAYRPFTVAAVWALYEYLKSSGYLGYPWGLIAYPAHAVTPLIQFVEITGVWGLSLLMATVNGVAAEWLDLAWQPRRGVPARLWRGSAGAALLVAAALGYGAAALQRELPAAGSADLVLVQHNANPWQSGDDAGTLRILEALTAEGIAADPVLPDLVVWSETAVRYPVAAPPSGGAAAQAPPPLRRFPVPLLTGVPWLVSEAPAAAMNAAMLVAPGGEVAAHYGKQHLVPFAESVPFWELAAVRRFFSEVIGLQATWVPGTEATIFSVPLRRGGRVRFATPICFEDAFPDLNRRFIRAGADLLINLTNDAWSQTVSAETQHFVAAKLRAVENRRVLVRATNGGVTAAIDPWGRIIGSAAPLFTATWVRLQVPVYRPPADTPYTRFGDWLPPLLGLVLGVPLAVTRWRSRQRSGWRSGRRSGPGGSGRRTPPAA